jgi:hypothetical protein
MTDLTSEHGHHPEGSIPFSNDVGEMVTIG